MKREIADILDLGYCCPGHDKYPSDTYKNRRSKKRRSEDIKKEHRHARRAKKLKLQKEVKEEIDLQTTFE